MVWKCISCGVVWSLDVESDYSLDDISSGLCPLCFRERASVVWRYQERMGIEPCFLRRKFCDDLSCEFIKFCQDRYFSVWLSRIIFYSEDFNR